MKLKKDLFTLGYTVLSISSSEFFPMFPKMVQIHFYKKFNFFNFVPGFFKLRHSRIFNCFL